MSNGLDWSPDDQTMYYIDSPTRRIDAFDFDAPSGTIERRRLFARVAAADGAPDGLTVDADGFVWVALWGAGKLRRFAPDGAVADTVDLPVPAVASCAFGGRDLRDLFVTTAWYGLSQRTRRLTQHM